MKKSLFIVALALGTLAFSSCASKKDLENCRTENNQLTADYQNAKETIAANNARIKSLGGSVGSGERECRCAAG